MFQKYFILLLSLLPIIGSGQYDVLKKETLAHLSPLTSSLTWEKEMVGQLDERHPFYLFLITDTKQYQGAYQFENDDNIHYFEGEMDENQISLFEYDESQSLVATITGDFNNFTFYGNWADKNQLEEYSFIFYDRKSTIKNDLLTDWIKSLSNEQLHFLLIKTKDEYTLVGSYEQEYFSTPIECLDADCTIFKAYLKSESMEESVPLSFVFKGNKVIYEIIPTDEKIDLQVENNITFDILSNPTNPQKSYGIKPIFNAEKLNNQWTSLIQPFANINSANTNIPAFESSMEINAEYLDARYFSGTIQYQNNQNSNIDEVGFLVDLKRKKIKSGTDFIPDFKKVQPLINNKMDGLEIKDSNKEIEIYNICLEGLKAKTKNHILYGQREVVIPHHELPKKILK